MSTPINSKAVGPSPGSSSTVGHTIHPSGVVRGPCVSLLMGAKSRLRRPNFLLHARRQRVGYL